MCTKNLIWNLWTHLTEQQNGEYIQFVDLLLCLVLEIIIVVNMYTQKNAVQYA